MWPTNRLRYPLEKYELRYIFIILTLAILLLFDSLYHCLRFLYHNLSMKRTLPVPGIWYQYKYKFPAAVAACGTLKRSGFTGFGFGMNSCTMMLPYHEA